MILFEMAGLSMSRIHTDFLTAVWQTKDVNNLTSA